MGFPLNDLTAGLGGVHDLLFRVLATETGLGAPMSWAAQYEAVRGAFPALKRQALAQVDGEALVTVYGGEAPPRVLRVAGDRDGLAFAELYRGLQLFVGSDVLNEYAVNAAMSNWVLPFAARSLLVLPAVRAAVLETLRAHHARYGEAVAQRNRNSLANTFRCPSEFLVELTASPAPGAPQDHHAG